MTTLPQIYEQMVRSGDLTEDPAQTAVLPEFERIRAALAAPAPKGWFAKKPVPPKGLYLWGGVGRGKSMLMDLFVQHLEVPSRRVHFHEFMQNVHKGMKAARAEGVDDALKPVGDALIRDLRLLALDEMQITDITDAMIVGRLFQQLFEAGVVVVTTSNRVPDDLYKDGLNREIFLPFTDLLKDRMVVHELTSPKDYRQDRLEGSPVYFTPLGPETSAQMNALWADLTQGNAGPLTLRVQGRDVILPSHHNAVARATFFDMCGQPLGPADYLAVAEAVRVLVLDNVPQLGRSNFNEARRFVTLIDALYEAGVRLIASAAASPEMLYIEGEGTFEFERTASRLREMQSVDWGKDR